VIIGLKTDAACGHCPLSLLCMTGHALIVNKRSSAGLPTVRRNIYHVRVCQRCHCVYFSHDNQTYLCGRLRHAVHRPDEKPGLDAVHAACYGHHHRNVCQGSMPRTKACSKGQSTFAKAALPDLIEDKFAPIDMWDCFAFTRDHIKEIW